MSIKSRLSGSWNDFKNGLAFLFSKPEQGEGDRKLAKISALVEAQIPISGKHAVRTQVIKSIEKDLRKAAKRGGEGSVDKLVDNALTTPGYVHMLHKIGLTEANVRVMAMGAKKS